MSGRRIEAAYITRPVSIAYLTGVHADPFERLMALAVRDTGATLIVPAIEHQNASMHVHDAEVVGWRDGEDPYAQVARALTGCVEVAVEKEHLSLHAAEVITSRTGVSELVDVGPEIRRLRTVKHPDEIDRLTRAAAITDAATDEVLARVRAGQTEMEVAVMLGSAIAEQGGTLAFGTLVQSGPNSALPHAAPSGRRFAPGDLILFDFGAAFEGYKADTRGWLSSERPALVTRRFIAWCSKRMTRRSLRCAQARRPARSTPPPGESSRRPVMAIGSSTARAMASAWRLTKLPTSILVRTSCSSPAWCSRSSPGSTSRVGAG
jgi:Xaa-Pro dipeptidase